jgi:hypothetical protein
LDTVWLDPVLEQQVEAVHGVEGCLFDQPAVNAAVALGLGARGATLVPMAMSEPSAASAVEPICSLPIVGPTTVEDAVFYTAVGAVAIVGWVAWPTAALIGTGHALHQRARNVIRAGAVGAAREGLIEAVDDVF